MRPTTPINYYLKSELSMHYASLSARFNPLHSSMNQGLFEKHLCYQSSHCKICEAPRTLVNGAAPINYHLKSEIFNMLCCQLCSTHYTAVQIKNYPKSTSVIKVITTKNTAQWVCNTQSKAMQKSTTLKENPWLVTCRITLGTH